MRRGAARRFAVAGACALAGLAGACSKGTVSFTLETPQAAALSPLADARRDSIALLDEKTGMALGQPVSAVAMSGMTQLLGDLPVTPPGQALDIRLTVTGGAQLLGLARARNVTLVGLTDQTIALHVRKPLAYFGSLGELPSTSGQLPGPSTLMILDTTLPPGGVEPSAPPQPVQASATATTFDGQVVLVGGDGAVLALDSRNHQKLQELTISPAGSGTPQVLSLAVSPDDRLLAVVTDQGLAIADLQAFLDGGGKVAQARQAGLVRAAFSADASELAVLEGPSWMGLGCAGKPAASQLYRVARPAPGAALGSGKTLGFTATDVAYSPDGGAIVFAAPCGNGVVDAMGATVLAGVNIYRVVATPSRLYGVEGAFSTMAVPFDPDDPTLRNVSLPFARVVIHEAGAANRSVPFQLPSDRLTISSAGTGLLQQFRLLPSSMIAYSIAASPDGAHLVVANAVHYQESGTHYFDGMSTDTLGNPYTYYCALDAQADYYHLTELDAGAGTVGYQSTRGLTYSSCHTSCFVCDANMRNCKEDTTLRQACFCDPNNNCVETTSAGFIPGGLSILMGSH